MTCKRHISILAFACLLAGTAAHAGDSHNFFLRTGPAMLFLSEGAKVKAGGAPVAGGTISVDPHATGTFEFGYMFTPNLGVSFTGGVPPTVAIDGAGTLAGVGELGTITYGPTALTAHYHFTNFGNFQPYIGGGPMAMFVFNEKDTNVTNLNVKPAIGAVFQVGADYWVNEKWGVYVDAKKAYLRTKSTGSLGGTPISADVKMDPLVISAGLTVRF